MGQVRKYNVVQNGYPTVLKLNDADAKLYPDAELVDDQADADAKLYPDAELVDDQADAEQGSEQPAGKSRTAANKGRTPANKSREA
ncbi:hypothetical protein [Micromonospora sp. DT227]|uniref:hypothetical protein n=1 Tax=Micromonospora sp. DT227 TaxID=3393433 RepID=UPI003CED3EB7